MHSRVWIYWSYLCLQATFSICPDWGLSLITCWLLWALIDCSLNFWSQECPVRLKQCLHSIAEVHAKFSLPDLELCTVSLSGRLEIIKHIRLQHCHRQRYPCPHATCPGTFKTWNAIHIHLSRVHSQQKSQDSVICRQEMIILHILSLIWRVTKLFLACLRVLVL